MKHKAGFVNIIGNPNVGKSTLMNALVGEKLSIITPKAQTTRHRILGIVNEEEYQIVFSDTPGIIQPAYELQSSMMDFVKSALDDADVLIYMVEVGEKELKNDSFFKKIIHSEIPVILLLNKIDKLNTEERIQFDNQLAIINYPLSIEISAKQKEGIDALKNELLSFVNTGALRNNETIVTNTRHYDSLLKALEEVQKVKYGIESNTSSDFIAIDIRQALYYFGEITGEVTNDELLGNIFANFCIGK